MTERLGLDEAHSVRFDIVNPPTARAKPRIPTKGLTSRSSGVQEGAKGCRVPSRRLPDKGLMIGSFPCLSIRDFGVAQVDEPEKSGSFVGLEITSDSAPSSWDSISCGEGPAAMASVTMRSVSFWSDSLGTLVTSWPS